MGVVYKLRLKKLHQWFLANNIRFFVLLLVQNIVIFWQHYFINVGFPWDFELTYYALPAFWTTSISTGIFPQWIPYEGMGYPLAINSQSGLYYPIFWIFALLHIPYTLHDAVILQVLTIFFGSIGMFLLLNLIFKSTRYAFIGALAFQFFGGFYSNAEHQDIIRAFAIAPWLFYVFKLQIDKPKVTARILFIPIVIYFLATGGYPGNIISSIFIIIVFLCLQIAHGYLKNVEKIRCLKVGAGMVGLMIIGISISAIHLGPILQERNDLTRFQANQTQPLPTEGLGTEDIPALFMSSRPIPGEPSMTSTFVTLPMLIFASFIPISALKRNWIWIAILILSVLMVAGTLSPFWQAITSAVPTLKLSRFPSSDYRVFVAIPIIILGTAGLRGIIENKLSTKEFIARSAFVVTWFSVGVFSLYSSSNFFVINNHQLFMNFEIATAAFIVFLTTLLILTYTRKNKSLEKLSYINKPLVLSNAALILTALLISTDGFRVISDMQTWKAYPFNDFYAAHNIPLEKNGKLVTYSIFEKIPIERPARESVGPGFVNSLHYSWKGYLQGDYMMEDYGNTMLNARSNVESNYTYRNYMLMKWTPLILQPTFVNKPESQSINIPVNMFSNKQLLQAESSHNANHVLQTHYGINDITYKVTLKEPMLMVENEIYFPGWEADLIFPDKEMKLHASRVNDVFRAWLLPAGDYQMVAHFNIPNLIIYQSISIISFAVWIFILVRHWRNIKFPPIARTP